MNKLTLKDEFAKVLQGYKISAEARKILDNTELVLLVGPSSSGRNTIINELQKSGKYHYIVSDTTRLPRVNNGVLEQDGREYWFRREDEVLSDLQSGQFMEAAIIHEQQVSGISMRELAAAAQEHKIAINEIEVVGADNIHALKKDAMFFFVLPPSFDEWMARMSARTQLPNDEVRRRLGSAVSEIETALERDYYWFIVNDTFMHTAREIERMISEKTIDEQIQAEGRRVAQRVLDETKQYLSVLDKA